MDQCILITTKYAHTRNKYQASIHTQGSVYFKYTHRVQSVYSNNTQEPTLTGISAF